MPRSTSVLPSLLVFAGLVATGAAANAQARPFHCKNAAGGTTIQQTPCPVVNPAPKPPKRLPCDLDPEQRKQAIRMDRQFLKRYPEEASHRRAQLADLQQVVNRIRVAHTRFNQLAAERKPLDKERAFYENKPMPAWLKSKLDASDAQFAALTDILQGREQEIGDIQARYQCQRDTFGKLWGDAAPGSSACSRPACAPA